MRRLFVLCLAGLLLSACGDSTTPEARLVAALDAMEEAAEAGQRGRFMDFVADDFAGAGGRLDRQGLADMFRTQLLVHTRVSALVTNRDIELIGDRATASFNALLTGGPRAWLPESGDLYRVDTGWRMDGGEWRLISADWRPLVGG